MASKNVNLVEEPPALQPVQAPEQKKQPTLVEGRFQFCEGHMKRRSKILKRWKKEYIEVVPGTRIRTSKPAGVWSQRGSQAARTCKPARSYSTWPYTQLYGCLLFCGTECPIPLNTYFTELLKNKPKPASHAP